MGAAVVTSRFGAGERLQGMDAKHPFEKVVADHGATVLRVCRVLLAGPDADDACSETFLAALRAYPDLPETANTEAWLVTIAHRRAIDLLRAPANCSRSQSKRCPNGPPGSASPARMTQAYGRRSASCPASSAKRWPTTTSHGGTKGYEPQANEDEAPSTSSSASLAADDRPTARTRPREQVTP